MLSAAAWRGGGGGCTAGGTEMLFVFFFLSVCACVRVCVLKVCANVAQKKTQATTTKAGITERESFEGKKLASKGRK